MFNKRLGLGLGSIALAVAMSAVAQAGSVTVDGVTLTYPEFPLSSPGAGTAAKSCEPWNSAASQITFSGVPEGATVTVNFGWFDPYGSGQVVIQPSVQYNGVSGGTLAVPVPYPMDTATWPGFVAATNERSIGVTVFATVTSGGVNTKISGAKWWVKCAPPPPPPPDEGKAGGCTPGYWRQTHHFDSWVTYVPTDDFGGTFGVTPSFSPSTLRDAVWLGGGGERALARHAVAALLNAARTNYSFTFTAGEVIAGVQNAYLTGNFESFKDQLDAANNTGCPLN